MERRFLFYNSGTKSVEFTEQIARVLAIPIELSALLICLAFYYANEFESNDAVYYRSRVYCLKYFESTRVHTRIRENNTAL